MIFRMPNKHECNISCYKIKTTIPIDDRVTLINWLENLKPNFNSDNFSAFPNTNEDIFQTLFFLICFYKNSFISDIALVAF